MGPWRPATDARTAVGGLVGQLVGYLRGLLVRSRPDLGQVVFAQSRSEMPPRLKPHQMVVIGSTESSKWIVFLCSCGRGHRIELSLQQSHERHWTLSFEQGLPSIWPSVDYRGSLRCHFVVRRGRVEWVPEQQPLVRGLTR